MKPATHGYRQALRRAGALAASLVLLAGCSSGATGGQAGKPKIGINWNSDQPPAQSVLLAQNTGALTFRVDTSKPGLAAKALPTNTTRVVLTLTASVLSTPLTIEITPNQFANGSVLFTVHTLPAGQYTVGATVYGTVSGSEAQLAAGTTTATVVAGATSPVTLLLTADPNSTTGALQVSIDTTAAAAAAAALTLPTSGKVLGEISLSPGKLGHIAFDASGNLWVSSAQAGIVYKIDPVSLTTLAQYNLGVQVEQIAFDHGGNVWVSTRAASEIRKILPDNSVSGPYSITDASWGMVVQQVTVNNTPTDYIWVSNTGHFSSGNFHGHTVDKLDTSGTVLATLNLPDESGPNDIRLDSSGNLWIGHRKGVSKINTSTQAVTDYTLDSTRNFRRMSLAIAGDGSIWATSDSYNTVYKLNSDGSVAATYDIGTGVTTHWGLGIDSYNAIWLLDGDGPGHGTLTKLDTNGTILATYPLPTGVFTMSLDTRGNPWYTGGENNELLHKIGR